MFPFARSHCIGPAVADAECRMGIESNEEDITIPIMYTLRTSQHVEEWERILYMEREAN